MQAVELRSRLQREIAAKEKEAKERELRELAMRARMDRVGGGAPAPAASRGAGTAAAGWLSDSPSCRHSLSPGSGRAIHTLHWTCITARSFKLLYAGKRTFSLAQDGLSTRQASRKAC